MSNYNNPSHMKTLIKSMKSPRKTLDKTVIENLEFILETIQMVFDKFKFIIEDKKKTDYSSIVKYNEKLSLLQSKFNSNYNKLHTYHTHKKNYNTSDQIKIHKNYIYYTFMKKRFEYYMNHWKNKNMYDIENKYKEFIQDVNIILYTFNNSFDTPNQELTDISILRAANTSNKINNLRGKKTKRRKQMKQKSKRKQKRKRKQKNKSQRILV